MWLEYCFRSYITAFILYILLTIVVTYISYLLYKRQQTINKINLLPGPKTFPFIGNLLDIYGNPTEYFRKIITNVCIHPCGLNRVWIGNKPMCILYKANVLEVILSSQKHLDKTTDYDDLHPWLGTGLLTSTGRKWHSRRKMLTPSFHFKILEDYIEVFNQQSSKFISIIEVKADGTQFDILTPIALCTLDIILESAMGRSINAQDNSDSDYVKAVNRFGTLMVQRQLKPWLQPDILYRLSGFAKEQEECLKILHGLSNETIKDRRKEYQIHKSLNINKGVDDKDFGIFEKKRKRLAFLDLLLQCEDGDRPLSDEDIREEVDTFMFEGHDTTAAAITWSIYLLGSYPEIQDKVYEELNTIFDESERPATSADLREMKYLECCIKEALRIFPSVPFMGRKISEDVTVDGYTIPGGINVYVNQYTLHRDPEYFPDPEEFKPERFFSENSVKRHPFAYVPFSAGPRNCIGQKFAMMEEKVVLSSFLRKFRVESVEKREDLKISADLILRPENGTPVKIYYRK